MINTDEKIYRHIADSVLNLIFPEKLYCHCCGDFIDKSRLHGLCDSCIEKIDWDIDNPFKNDMQGFCFDELFCCCRYGYYPRQIIHKLKLYGKTYIAKDLGGLMSERIALENLNFDLVIPVPMSNKKKRSRGYNQAQLLAEEISKELSIRLDTKALVKEKETGSMRLSSAVKRSFMLEGAFSVKCPEIIQGKSILLVDDVVTTGTTINECARQLKANGAEKVYAACFAS